MNTLKTLSAMFAVALATATVNAAQPATVANNTQGKSSFVQSASTIVTKDNVHLYYKDWGPRDGKVVMFSHGWPLNSDSWESQMMFLASNGYRVPSPKGGEWRRSTIHGDPKDLSGILNNPLYVGQEIWGRGKWETNPENGKRVRKAVDRSDWIVIESPHLRIIDADLWNRVKERQSKISLMSAGKKAEKGPTAATGANPKYLLSGLRILVQIVH